MLTDKYAFLAKMRSVLNDFSDIADLTAAMSSPVSPNLAPMRTQDTGRRQPAGETSPSVQCTPAVQGEGQRFFLHFFIAPSQGKSY